MKTLILCTIAVLLIAQGAPVVKASELNLSFEANPTPLYSQFMAYETYVFNVTVENRGVAVAPGEYVDEAGKVRYTGRLVITLRFIIRGRGSYDFGDSTTGYTTSVLEEIELSTTIKEPSNLTRAHVLFNYTFTKDAYEYGLMPYEDVDVTVKAGAHHEVYNQTTGSAAPFRGLKVGEAIVVYSLIDETKIAYIEGKLVDVEREVRPIQDISGPEYVDATLYLKTLNDMNSSVKNGDYVGALKIYHNYDEKYRQSLIRSLTKEAEKSRERAITIAELEWRILQLETTLEQEADRFQGELDQAQARYATLSQTYQIKQAELEAAKQSLTTAITAVFLASMVFFFLGRRTASGKLFEGGRVDQGVDGDEAAPNVR